MYLVSFFTLRYLITCKRCETVLRLILLHVISDKMWLCQVAVHILTRAYGIRIYTVFLLLSSLMTIFVADGLCKQPRPSVMLGLIWIQTALESPYHLAAVSGAHFTQRTILIVILVSSGSAKSRTHQSAVGGFLVTRRGWPGRLRACRIWTFINSV